MKLLELTLQQKKLIQQIADILVGLPYKYGVEVDLKQRPEELKKKNQPFDCSELVEYIYYQLGYIVPDGSYNQYNASCEVNTYEIGNLVFKRDLNTKKISHSAIIIETTPVIVLEAEGWYKRVIKRSIDDFMKKTKNNEYASMRRFIVDYIKIV